MHGIKELGILIMKLGTFLEWLLPVLRPGGGSRPPAPVHCMVTVPKITIELVCSDTYFVSNVLSKGYLHRIHATLSVLVRSPTPEG